MGDIKSKARPQMVILARESRGLSQSALAAHMGIAQGTLSKVENGQADATDEFVEKLSDALGYPPAFFFDDYAARNLPISFYRKRISTKISTVRAIRARINILRLHVQKLLLSVDLPECRVPSINLSEYGGSPERVARELRIRWHLPRGPIENLTDTLEDAGVVIVRCDFGTNEVDAISLWEPADDIPPMVFVSDRIPGDRLRFSLAHETAHLMLHSHLPLPSETIEAEANAFASEFLMPSSDIRNFLNRINLSKLAALKPHWKVSMQSLLERAWQLEQVTDRQRRYFWMQINARGYRTEEPFPIEREEPKLINELILTHIDELKYDDASLSKLVHLTLPELRSVYRGGSPKLRLLKPLKAHESI
jgi:Zn-dependent peptidase ImmA (M78 family)